MRARPAVRLLGALAALALLGGSGVPARAQSDCQRSWWGQARVAIVYPEGGLANLARSTRVNISVWPQAATQCNWRPEAFTLWVARDNEPVVPVATADQGEMILRPDGDHFFPSVEFNNIPADLRDGHQYRFTAGGNVWVHAVDARTYYPEPVVPAGFAEGKPGRAPDLQQLDVRIQTVWPHDGQGNYEPVDQARYVDVGVEIFRQGTLLALADYGSPLIVLYAAQGNGRFKPAIPVDFKSYALQGPQQAVRTVYHVGDTGYPRWVFRNIPVEPGQQTHFMVHLHGYSPSGPTPDAGTFQSYSTIWTHATDPRTYLPSPQPPRYNTADYDTPEALGCTR